MQNSVNRQIGGFFLSPEWICNPEKATPYIRQMVEHGYYAAHAIVWHLKFTVADQEVHDCIKSITEIAHGHGLKIILNTDYDNWAVGLVQKHPETGITVAQGIELRAHNGKFETLADFPNSKKVYCFEKIIAAYTIENGKYNRIDTADLNYDWMNKGQPGGVYIKGCVPGNHSGKMLIYPCFRSIHFIDVASSIYLKKQRELLDSYADIPLDGFAWDEPGKGMGDVKYIKLGDAFLKLFEKLNGYDLLSKIEYLDHMDDTGEAAKVRCDYHSSLVEMNYEAQKQHNDYAQSLYPGKKLIFGTHQTWSGIPTDMASGTEDYFKLAKVSTEAWTDGSWEVPLKYSAFHFMLAEGIKKELGFRNAYYNDWTYSLPAVENMHFANRFKMLFHINWYNHCFSDFSERLVNFRVDPLRSEACKDSQNLNKLDSMIGETFKPYSDVALLFMTKGINSAPGWVSGIFYSALANLSLHLAESGLYTTVMGTESIKSAKTGKGSFETRGLTYKTLIVPFANTLPGEIYDKIIDICKAGVNVVFFGTPPQFIAETGDCIGEKFASELGMAPIALTKYLQILNEQVPSIQNKEQPWIDFNCPIDVTKGEKHLNTEGHIAYIKAPGMPLYYMPSPDPREDIINLIEPFSEIPGELFANNSYCRFYINPADRNEAVLVAVSKAHIASCGLGNGQYEDDKRPPVKPRPLNVLMRGFGGELLLKGGSWCAIHLKDGKMVKNIGDCPQALWT